MNASAFTAVPIARGAMGIAIAQARETHVAARDHTHLPDVQLACGVTRRLL